MNQLRLARRSRARLIQAALSRWPLTQSSDASSGRRILSRGGNSRAQRRITSSSDQFLTVSGSSLKTEMQMEMLRTKSPEMVGKEVAMHLLAYNLIRGIMAEAARTVEVKPRRLSFTGALHTVASFEVAISMIRRESWRISRGCWS